MDLEKRNAALLEAIKDESQAIDKIAHDFGISAESVRRIARLNGIPPRKKGRRANRQRLEHSNPISPLHEAVGLKVNRYRSLKSESPYTFAEKAKMSMQRLRTIETGCQADLTLTDLNKLADAMGCNVTELVAYKETA